MTVSALIVRAVLTDLRDAAIAAYSNVSDAPLPIPTPNVPPTGQSVVIDCGDLLLVNCTGLTSAFQGPSEMCAIVMQVNANVTVTRCIPNLTNQGKPAPKVDQTVAALSLADDLTTVWLGLVHACQAGTLWGSFDGLGCGDTVFRNATPGASGGIGWFTIPVQVRITRPLTESATGDLMLWLTGEAVEWSVNDPVVWET